MERLQIHRVSVADQVAGILRQRILAGELLLAGSLVLPVFVLLELKLGLAAGGIADAGGLMVIVALIAMLVGVLRYSGSLDGAAGAQV
jgi:hypothetical protein